MVFRQQQTGLSDFEPCEIPHDRSLSRRMHELVSDHPDFEVLGAPAPGNYCFRYLPNNLVERQEEAEVRELLDRLNHEIVEIVRRSGFKSVITSRTEGCVAIQISISSGTTRAHEIEAMFEAIARWGRLLNKKYSVPSERTPQMEVPSCSSESHSSSTEVSAI